jgi:hypothetical protein
VHACVLPSNKLALFETRGGTPPSDPPPLREAVMVKVLKSAIIKKTSIDDWMVTKQKNMSLWKSDLQQFVSLGSSHITFLLSYLNKNHSVLLTVHHSNAGVLFMIAPTTNTYSFLSRATMLGFNTRGIFFERFFKKRFLS